MTKLNMQTSKMLYESKVRSDAEMMKKISSRLRKFSSKKKKIMYEIQLLLNLKKIKKRN